MSAPNQGALDQRLNTCLDPEAQLLLIDALWGSHFRGRLVPDGLEFPHECLVPFLGYYSQQCGNAFQRNATTVTHQQIVDVAAVLRQAGATWQRLPQHITHVIGQAGEDQMQRAIHLVSRLLTMMRIGEMPQQFSRGRGINWDKGTLSEFLHDQFPSTPVLSSERTKFEKTFNVLGLVKIAGLEVHWTDNLADHLRLVNDDRGIRVFHHATFLLGQEER